MLSNTGPGPYTKLATALANTTTYTDTTADPTVAYQYRVTAFNAAGDSPSNVITVLQPTTTVVTSSAAPATFGQNITFTATVRPGAGNGTPAGTVQFNIDGVNTGAARALNAQGAATYSTTTLPAGNHTVVATYTGSAAYSGSTSASLAQVVNQAKAPATTVLTSNATPSVFGQSVTFTARVTPAAATGTVTFKIDGTTSNPVTLDGTGRATLVTTTLGVGTHTVSATYPGSVNYMPSTSAITQTVNKASSNTLVTSSGSPVTRGTNVTFTATASAAAPGAGTPTGTVQFLVDGKNVGAPTALTPIGRATYSTSTLTAGTHLVSAVYSGDGNFNTVTSTNITQRIL